MVLRHLLDLYIMKELGRKLTPFHWFLIKASCLYLLWVFVLEPYVVERNGLNTDVTIATAKVSSWLVPKVSGFQSSLVFPEGDNEVELIIDNRPSVSIADECNALIIMILYIGFVLAYPGKIKYKLLFITLGTVIVFCMNIVRILALAFNYIYHPSSFEFNHKYTFTFMVYLVVFALWMIWANRFSTIKFQPSN